MPARRRCARCSPLTPRAGAHDCHRYVGVGVIRLISESCTLVGPMVLHGLVDTVHNWDEESGSMLHVFGLGFLLCVPRAAHPAPHAATVCRAPQPHTVAVARWRRLAPLTGVVCRVAPVSRAARA